MGKILFPKDEMHFTIDIQASNSDEKRERVTVYLGEKQEIPNSKGDANFLVKWEGAKQVSTMDIMEQTQKLNKEIKALKGVTLFEYPESGGAEKLVAIFECRGVEPVKWYPTGGVVVVSSGGKKFDLDQEDFEDWMEVDPDTNDCVTISGLDCSFKLVK